MAYDSGRVEIPMEAENQDRGTCGYIAALPRPGAGSTVAIGF